MPIVLTGAIALGVGVATPADAASPRKPHSPRPQHAPEPVNMRSVVSGLGAAIIPGALATRTAAATTAPAVYTVAPGDTVSSIAQSFGLPTAAVLALNGLSWSAPIFPGQVLRLTSAPVKATGLPTPTTVGGVYTIVKGDTLSSLAARFGVTTQAILDANGLTWTSIVYPGQSIVVPGRVPAPAPAPAPIVGAAADVPVETSSARVAASAPIAEQAAAGDAGGTELAAAVADMTVAKRPVLPAAPPPVAAPPVVNRPTVPSTPGTPSTPRPPSGGTVTPLTAEMRTHAATIVRVGRELGVPTYGIVIALATAMQESSLRNLSWGDRDSVGLFQQRPSSGWGTAADLQIPSHAARLFYVGRSGYTRGLLDIPGWQSMTLTRAAQAVQISAYPDAYAKWETSAWAWYDELT
ncbi:LysM peptidoglycan-binding domain-containing protein [Microcella frigidaquae]|nr:LysM peptidoglycan-binding domain-containing protein [Microcella frigidaquae]